MFSLKKIIVFVSGIILFSGCSQVNVKHISDIGEEGSIVNGMPFYLPKTVLKLSYSGDQVTDISTENLPDNKAIFSVNPEVFSNFFTDSAFSIKIGDDGVLDSLGISLTDHSMDILSSFVKIGLGSKGFDDASRSGSLVQVIDPSLLAYTYSERKNIYEADFPIGHNINGKILSPIDLSVTAKINNNVAIKGIPFRMPISVAVNICEQDCNDTNIKATYQKNILRMDIIAVAKIKSGILSGSSTRNLNFVNGFLSEYSSSKMDEKMSIDKASGSTIAASLTEIFKIIKENEKKQENPLEERQSQEVNENCPEYLENEGGCSNE
ncbi:hypothetical protein [Thiothrix subterranea]|uniref:Uncharacterized protein n=1 Tax=Thiothrix subterranea TaxID=2735563 RepID=A0AA51MSN5_9GAMM|nr:hypothetical protein [Thiothrix subterranea]MDQ5770720.1 hypothetical protein [Thiothrix subterranea]WML87722.1 hypothetical protein RCG00_04990 [Thiothrix subterranea]